MLHGRHPRARYDAAMRDHAPRRALVTGASSGIGYAAARRLAEAGWDVTCLVRREVAPDGTRIVRGDATEAAAIGAALAAAAPDGRLDALICAAGTPPSGPWDDEAHWARTLEVDLTAPWRAARLAWPALRAAHGTVVLVGSIVGGAEGSGRSPAYAAAKAGLEGLARSLAVVGGPDGVRVNVVAPGAIDTPFDPAAFPPDARPDVPLGRMGTAEEAAAVVTLLCDPATSYVTGATWVVDGGRSVLSPAASAIALRDRR